MMDISVPATVKLLKQTDKEWRGATKELDQLSTLNCTNKIKYYSICLDKTNQQLG